MAQFSMLPWETQTGTGDGVFSYNQDQANDFFRYADVSDPTTEGVWRNRLNNLAVTGAVSPLSVDTGAAVCYGRYWNDASVNLAVTTPTSPANPTGGRVVLRADWATNTIRLAISQSADGTPGAPALTQTAGTLWEISLYTYSIDGGGNITLTDDRTFIGSRTRRIFVQAAMSENITDGGRLTPEIRGWTMADNKQTEVYGAFHCPDDMIGDATINIVVIPNANGDIVSSNEVDYGACSESPSMHSDINGAGNIVTVTAATLECIKSITFSSLAAGDIVLCKFVRLGAAAGDTINDSVWCPGWVFSYTAEV